MQVLSQVFLAWASAHGRLDKACNVRLWKYHEPPLSFVLTFCSLSKDEITDERVCALVRELQVNQSHQNLEWVQPFMSKVLRGACWDCSVIPIPVHWNNRENLHAWWQLQTLPLTFGTIYMHGWLYTSLTCDHDLIRACYLWPTTWCACTKVWFQWIFINLCFLVFDSPLYTAA